MTLPPNCLSAEPSATPGAPSSTPAQAPAAAHAGTPFASILTQADAKAADTTVTPGESAQTEPVLAPFGMNSPALFPGVYCQPRPQAGSPVVGDTSVQVPAQTVSADVLGADTSATAEELGKKPEMPREALPKEKQKSLARSEETANATTDQGAMLIAYQFVAGQWIQQPIVPPAASDQLSTGSLDGKTGGNAAPAVASVLSSDPSFKNNAPAKEQEAGQSVVGSVIIRKDAGEVSALANKNVAPSPTDAIFSEESKAAAPRLNDKASSLGIQDSKATDGSPPSAQEKTAVASKTDLPTDGSGTKIPSWRSEQGSPVQLQVQEKFAALNPQMRSESATRVNSSNGKEEKKSLSVDGKDLTSPSKSIGTSAANRENVMPYSAVNKSPAVEFSTTARDGIQANVAADAKTEATVATHAPRLVQEIRQIADRISVVDRNSVEMRFDFSATDRLSVRVEYRDGIVHTTFRTDSAELRDAISHEWQGQAAADQRPYRMAEPVYSQTTSNRQDFSSLGGDGSGRQRAFEQPAVPASAGSARNMNFTTQSEAPTLASRVFRPETSHHLHALA